RHLHRVQPRLRPQPGRRRVGAHRPEPDQRGARRRRHLFVDRRHGQVGRGAVRRSPAVGRDARRRLRPAQPDPRRGRRGRLRLRLAHPRRDAVALGRDDRRPQRHHPLAAAPADGAGADQPQRSGAVPAGDADRGAVPARFAEALAAIPLPAFVGAAEAATAAQGARGFRRSYGETLNPRAGGCASVAASRAGTTSMRRVLTLLALGLLLAACQREATPAVDAATTQGAAAPAPWAGDPSAQRIEADVRALADDAMEGRETGTRGYERASAYVAGRLADIGLQPAGDHRTLFQRVPLLKATRERDGARLVVRRHGREIALRFQDQFLPQPGFDAAQAQVEAPAVFVGQAVHAPALGVDDCKGLALTGKVAVLFDGAPARLDDDRRAFHASWREKLRAVAARGAVAAVFVNTAQEEASWPWAQRAAGWARPSMRLRGDDGAGIDTFPQLQGVAVVSAAAAGRGFADGSRTAAERSDAARGGTLDGLALPGTIALAARGRIEPIDSRNVVARLPGGDDALAGEHVVYTAHLDHIGIEAAAQAGDRINNGALDNALGVAIMLESARQLAAAKGRPERSQLFVATTAEEQGLLGAEWFATRPTVPAESMVANVNIDMPVLMAPTTDVVPIGVGHSTLKATLEAA